MRATDAPSTNVSSPIRRFSAMLRRCRWTALAESFFATIASGTCREVSISTPGGHLFLSVHFGESLSFRCLSRRLLPDAYLQSVVPCCASPNYGGLLADSEE